MHLQNYEMDNVTSEEEEKIILQDYYNNALSTLPSIDLSSTVVFNHPFDIGIIQYYAEEIDDEVKRRFLEEFENFSEDMFEILFDDNEYEYEDERSVYMNISSDVLEEYYDNVILPKLMHVYKKRSLCFVDSYMNPFQPFERVIFEVYNMPQKEVW